MEFKGTTEKWYSVFIQGNKRAVRSEGGIICVLTTPFRYTGQDERYEKELAENKADQKIIESAPEMLDALIHIEDYVTRSLTLSGNSEKDIDFILRKVRPVISKATE